MMLGLPLPLDPDVLTPLIKHMNKKSIKLLVILSIILLLFCLSFYIYKIYKNQKNYQNSNTQSTPISTSTKQELLNQSEIGKLNLYHAGIYEVLSRDKDNNITSYRVIGIKKPQELKLELMTDAEKAAQGVNPSSKIQVLERDESGKVTAYRLIKKDSDIVTEW